MRWSLLRNRMLLSSRPADSQGWGHKGVDLPPTGRSSFGVVGPIKDVAEEHAA